MTTYPSPLLTLALCGALLGACGPGETPRGAVALPTASQAPVTSSPAGTPTPPALQPDDEAARPARPAQPAPPPLDDDTADEVPAASATPSPRAAAQALERGEAFMRAFARTDLDQARWWAGVEGYFTPAAAPVYKSTLVANIPVHKVREGSARLAPGSTKYLARVAVGTDNGTWTVVLVRTETEWLVDRAVPPS